MNHMMVNMILRMEKELEMERPGQRRARRFPGDAAPVARWYQGKNGRVVESDRAVAGKPGREPRRSLLGRLFHRSRPHREPAGNEC